MSSFVSRLRAETSAAHDAVDAAFGRFDLADTAGYRAFLTAHARALPAAEAWLASAAVPAWRERTSLLAADLADLDTAMPAPLDFAPPPEQAYGVLYTIEGSRLGGAMLARSVPAGWPSRYLSARHLSGEWRALLGAIEREAPPAPTVAGALAAFGLYGQAV